ncbi:MAG: hypothetical protein KA957_10905 [Syntrophaceae bacterium]|nr:hypothetical protein [Syntrophaceae bacterium]
MTKAKIGFIFMSFAILLVCATMTAAQTNPASTGSYTKCTYTPPSNSGYAAASVWYPCSGAGPFAATTLTGGYTNRYSDMAWIANHLVTHGYIIFAMTPNNIYGYNSSWTTAHKAGISMLKSENTRTGSYFRPNPIKGKVNTSRLQIMGFSKGGGGALLASADLGSGVQTTQALAPYMDFSYSLRNIKAKTICYTGRSDIIASDSAVVRMYNSLPTSIDRTLGYFNGFAHTDWMTGTSYNTYNNRAKKYITAFMKYHLEGDAAYQTYLYGTEHNKDMSANWFYGYAHNTNF